MTGFSQSYLTDLSSNILMDLYRNIGYYFMTCNKNKGWVNMRTIKILVIILSILLTIGFGISMVHILALFNWHHKLLRYFIYGFAAFIPLWFLLLKSARFFSTFEHEFTHLIVGLLFLKKPAGFQVTEYNGGVTQLYGGNFLITLAPYFLPTLSFLLLPLYFVTTYSIHPYFFLLLGLFTSYHVLSTIQEFSYEQTDITKNGKAFSTIFLIFANLFCYGYIIAIVIGGFHLGWVFIKNGVFHSYNWIWLFANRI